MVLDILLAVTSGIVTGRVLDKYIGRPVGSEEAADVGVEATVESRVVTLDGLGEKRRAETDFQQGILVVLSGSREPMALSDIASKMEIGHYAPLIRPMRSLLDIGRVIKKGRTYLLSTAHSGPPLPLRQT